jgi:triosephosphate isomerase (TIM)
MSSTKQLRPWVAGNRKMHSQWPQDLEHITQVAQHAQNLPCNVSFFVPATVLAPLSQANCGLPLGGQDCHEATHGAYTGDISATMLQTAGASAVLLGHSERRGAYHETDARIAAKIQAAQKAKLHVLLCVGESLQTRQAGDALSFVCTQLLMALISAGEVDPTLLSVAYEPIWAIGTGLIPTTDDIAAMHAALYGVLQQVFAEQAAQVRILYGGSVNANNAATIAAVPHVNGALVGGACLQPETFNPIISAFAAR